MSTVDSFWRRSGAGPATLRALLTPAALAYRFSAAIRNRLYDRGVLAASDPPIATISVGNLTVGGTGKTPFAAWIVSELRKHATPAVILRGYGGDEVEVHRQLNPGVLVVVDADRRAALDEAASQGADVAVLDDGFQHRRVSRTADIVLVSVEQLLRGEAMLPAGPWREPLRSVRRAEAVVLTRKTASDHDADTATRRLRSVAPDVPIARVRLVPDALRAAGSGESSPLESVAGQQVLVIASVGEPELFAGQVAAAGAEVDLAAYRDHHDFTADEVMELSHRVPAGGLAICTLKDAVKLAHRWPGPSRLWYVSQRLVVDQGGELLDRLMARVLESRPQTLTRGGFPGAQVYPR